VTETNGKKLKNETNSQNINLIKTIFHDDKLRISNDADFTKNVLITFKKTIYGYNLERN